MMSPNVALRTYHPAALGGTGPPNIRPPYGLFILWGVVAGLWLAALAGFISTKAHGQTVESDPPASYGQGWIYNPEMVEQECRRLKMPTFKSLAPHLIAQAGGPEDVFLWDAQNTVLGGLIPPRDQLEVGCCVGFGTAYAVETLICVEIASDGLIRGPPITGEIFREVSPEAIYAGSRVQIGGGRLPGDGSAGVWAAKWVSTYGILPRDKYAWADLTAYSQTLTRQLGRTGVPAAGQTLAKEHPVRTAARVNSWAEVQAAIRNGYPVVVCSNVGFADPRDRNRPGTRDAAGFIRPAGTWNHCMAIDGTQGGSRPGGHVRNSWGPDAHKGPVGKGNPSAAGFWADADVIDRMARQGDTWALSSFEGFPSRRPRFRF